MKYTSCLNSITTRSPNHNHHVFDLCQPAGRPPTSFTVSIAHSRLGPADRGRVALAQCACRRNADGADLDELTNEVYAVAEAGLWTDGAIRTTVGQIVEFTRAGQIAVARMDGQVVGCVRVQRLDERTCEFGMLCADPAHRGIGIGRELIRFVERKSHGDGMSTMQLELLVPKLTGSTTCRTTVNHRSSSGSPCNGTPTCSPRGA